MCSAEAERVRQLGRLARGRAPRGARRAGRRSAADARRAALARAGRRRERDCGCPDERARHSAPVCAWNVPRGGLLEWVGMVWVELPLTRNHSHVHVTPL